MSDRRAAPVAATSSKMDDSGWLPGLTGFSAQKDLSIKIGNFKTEKVGGRRDPLSVNSQHHHVRQGVERDAQGRRQEPDGRHRRRALPQDRRHLEHHRERQRHEQRRPPTYVEKITGNRSFTISGRQYGHDSERYQVHRHRGLHAQGGRGSPQRLPSPPSRTTSSATYNSDVRRSPRSDLVLGHPQRDASPGRQERDGHRRPASHASKVA